jgi:CheY-like chemotaxis protein
MVERAEDDYYDVILMDIQMPNMNGYEASKIIRAMTNPKKNSIPIIAMTANAFEEDKREAIKCGMNGHLGKPVNVRALMKELSGILNN